MAAAALLGAGATAVAAPGASGDRCPPSPGGVTASITPTQALLCNSRITREWSIGADGSVVTTALRGHDDAARAGSGADFVLDIDGVRTSSTTGWVLASVTSPELPALPNRPRSGHGAALLFHYALVSAAAPVGVALDRLVILHPGAAVLETRSTLVNSAPAPVRVSAYSLDQVTPPDGSLSLPAEVHAYNDGSDWRDDYRHVSSPTGSFDVEGEVARFGGDAGFFLVSQRRGGAMSRVGRDADGRTWVGEE